MSGKTVEQAISNRFGGAVLWNERAKPHLQENVIREHSFFNEEEDFLPWPGNHSYVSYWVATEEGYAVGFNENPRGYTTPIVSLKNISLVQCLGCDYHTMMNRVKDPHDYIESFDDYINHSACPECDSGLTHLDYLEEIE